jgi:two-component system chemotaxis response regulator CheY
MRKCPTSQENQQKADMTHTTTALIVDDSRVSRMMARQFIHSARPDWVVEDAATGEEAIDKSKLAAPSLILIDVNMPGIGGLAAAEQLRALCPHAHIALVTANVQNATRQRANDLGIGFMEKPITETRIHALIAALGLE